MTHEFTIIAHRGDSSAAPENTLRAFDLALQQHFTNFETDCQLSADGVVVIVHDEKLGRVNNGAGNVADHTLEQLQQLDAGSWFDPALKGTKMPTLMRVLQRYLNQAHIHLELKSQQQQLPAAVAQLVQQQGWLKLQACRTPDAGAAVEYSFSAPGLTITSFHLHQLQASKMLLPQVPHGWLIQEISQEIIDQANKCGFEMLCPRANALTPEGVQLMKQHGLVVRAWGVKTIDVAIDTKKALADVPVTLGIRTAQQFPHISALAEHFSLWLLLLRMYLRCCWYCSCYTMW